MRNRNQPRLFLHLLPTLHLAGCFLIAALGARDAWYYLFWVDTPASAFILALAYNHDRPLLLFATVGTLWWYFVSLVLWTCYVRLRALHSAPEK